MRARLLTWVPAGLAAGLYLPCAAGRAILDVDEALYVQAGREMLARHDWVTPYVDGVRFLDKPPLLYWVLALLYRALGVTETAAHLPPAIAVVAATWILTRQATRAAGARAGFAAGLAFASSAGTYLFTRETLHDAGLVFFFVLAMDALSRWRAASGRAVAWVLVFCAALAGAALSKGLVGVVLPLTVAAVTLAVEGDASRLRPRTALLGGATFVAVALPWHLLASQRNPGFLRHYLINEQVLRFAGRREPLDFASVPLPVFLALILVWLFPWTAFLPAAAVGARAGRADPTESGALVRLSLAWTGVALAFFSVSARLEHYAFPLLPPLALLVGLAVSRAGEAGADAVLHRAVAWGFRGLALAGSLAAASALGLAGWIHAAGTLPFVGRTGPASLRASATDFGPLADLPASVIARLLAPAAASAVVLAAGGLTAWRLDRRGRRLAALLALSLAMAALGGLAHAALRICEDVVSSKRFGVALAARHLRPGDHVIVDGDYETANSIGFYAPIPLEVVDGQAPTLAGGLRYPDAPRVILSRTDLAAIWAGAGQACLLAREDRLSHAALPHAIPITRSVDRVLVCNRSSP